MRFRATTFLFGSAFCVAVASTSNAIAQLSPDPYNPWNSQYESYVYPSIPGGTGVYPGQAAYEMPSGNRSANRFSRDVLEDFDRPSLDERGGRVPLRRGVGIPYTRAYREYDEMYKRVYTPNANVDDDYNSMRQQRDKAYQALRASKDPKERSDLRRTFDLYNRKTLREQLLGGRAGRAERTGAGQSRVDARSRGSAGKIPTRPRALQSPIDDSTDERAEDAAPPRRGSTTEPRSRSSTRPGSPSGSTRSNSSSPEAVLDRSRSMSRGAASQPSSTTAPRRPRRPRP